MNYNWLTSAYGDTVPYYVAINQFLAILDQLPISTNNPANIGKNSEKFAPYWPFLKEHRSSCKSRNRKNILSTLKFFDQEERINTALFTAHLSSIPPFDVQ